MTSERLFLRDVDECCVCSAPCEGAPVDVPCAFHREKFPGAFQ